MLHSYKKHVKLLCKIVKEINKNKIINIHIIIDNSKKNLIRIFFEKKLNLTITNTTMYNLCIKSIFYVIRYIVQIIVNKKYLDNCINLFEMFIKKVGKIYCPN